MAPRHVVVDGSNIATEGRSMPSLVQLDQAVREFLTENPDDVVTVVVDASFGHRIDSLELKMFEEAETAGELVSPPAGAIGRGDAFLLRIADKTGATVLSNDSFQEFHGDYEWLFHGGRLIGGKPVPGVGWIFTPRTPVRGPRSREAVKEAKRKKIDEPDSNMPGLDLAAERARSRPKGKKNVERAIAVATEEAVAPKAKRRRRRKGGEPPSEAVNDPLTFITFIAAHPLGTEVNATVESFASHGAFVEVDGARCYVPLSAMGNPIPKSARERFSKGEQATFVIQALDPQRRGVELAVPEVARIAGAPTAETVAAEIAAKIEADEAGEGEPVAATGRRRRSSRPTAQQPAEKLPAAQGGAAGKTAAKRGTAPEEMVIKGPSRKDPREKAATPASSGAAAGAKTAVRRPTTGVKAARTAKRAPAPKAVAAKAPTAAKRAPATKAVATKRAPTPKAATAAKRAPAPKAAVAAKRASAPKAPTTAKRAPAPTAGAPAKPARAGTARTTAKPAPAKQAPAKKSGPAAKRAGVKQATSPQSQPPRAGSRKAPVAKAAGQDAAVRKRPAK